MHDTKLYFISIIYIYTNTYFTYIFIITIIFKYMLTKTLPHLDSIGRFLQ